MKPFRIGQVAKAGGVTVETVRYYGEQGLLTVSGRSPAHYRQYDESTVDRLRFILRAKDHGFTLREIKAILAIHDSHTATRADVRGVIEDKIAAVESQIRQLRECEDSLERLRKLCEGDGPASECLILKALSGAITECEQNGVKAPPIYRLHPDG